MLIWRGLKFVFRYTDREAHQNYTIEPMERLIATGFNIFIPFLALTWISSPKYFTFSLMAWTSIVNFGRSNCTHFMPYITGTVLPAGRINPLLAISNAEFDWMCTPHNSNIFFWWDACIDDKTELILSGHTCVQLAREMTNESGKLFSVDVPSSPVMWYTRTKRFWRMRWICWEPALRPTTKMTREFLLQWSNEI